MGQLTIDNRQKRIYRELSQTKDKEKRKKLKQELRNLKLEYISI